MQLFEPLTQSKVPNAHDLVAQDLEQRKQVGILTYGRFLSKDSPEDMLQMAYEEVLDLACYLKTEIEKRKAITRYNRPISVGERGPITPTTPSVAVWYDFMLTTLIPDYLKAKGKLQAHFTMNELKDFMRRHNYPYVDTHKRMSTAMKRLLANGYFYKVARYKWGATAQFVQLFYSLN
jgi:hypothetical protein